MTSPDNINSESNEANGAVTRACNKGIHYIKQHPAYAVLGSLAAGVVVGLLMPHREPTWQERYVAGPMDKARDLLRAAAEGATDGLHAVKDTASSAAGHASDLASKVRKYLFA